MRVNFASSAISSLPSVRFTPRSTSCKPTRSGRSRLMTSAMRCEIEFLVHADANVNVVSHHAKRLLLCIRSQTRISFTPNNGEGSCEVNSNDCEQKAPVHGKDFAGIGMPGILTCETHVQCPTSKVQSPPAPGRLFSLMTSERQPDSLNPGPWNLDFGPCEA